MRAILLVTMVAGLLTARVVHAAEDGNTAWAALENAEQFELLSLDPDKDKEKDGFHGYKILGQTTIKDAEKKKKLVTVFGKGIDDAGQFGAKCFEPRHGIRVKKGDKTYDFLICFKCRYVYIFLGDKDIDTWYTLKAPQTLFDKTLTDAKVPLPKTADDR